MTSVILLHTEDKWSHTCAVVAAAAAVADGESDFFVLPSLCAAIPNLFDEEDAFLEEQRAKQRDVDIGQLEYGRLEVDVEYSED